MKPRIDYEARFYVALKRITAYMSLSQLQREAERKYGLSYEEALEMAYENVQGEARTALHGYRRPRTQAVSKDGRGQLIAEQTNDLRAGEPTHNPLDLLR
jgi:hypothetical protein